MLDDELHPPFGDRIEQNFVDKICKHATKLQTPRGAQKVTVNKYII